MATEEYLKRKTSFKLAILQTHPIQYFSPLYKRLASEEGIDLTVFYCSRQGLDKYYDNELGITLQWDTPLLDGYNFKFLPDIWGNMPSSYSSKNIQPAIFKEIVQGGYDALWIYGYKTPAYFVAIAAAKLSRTILLIRSDTNLLSARLQQQSLKNKIRSPALKLIFRLFDGALAIGTNNAKHYQVHGMPENKIFSVPYAVDNELFTSPNKWDEPKVREVKLGLSVPLDMPVILFVGKLTPNKQPLTLLKSFHQMQKKFNKLATLVFVGEGGLRGELERYCVENNVRNVLFAGFVNQSNIIKYYAVADIFVLISIQEAWGLVVNEAMCAKNAVIVSEAVGASADLVIPGENGFIFPVGDIDALTMYLTNLVSDPALCQRMGERSLEIITRWGFAEDVQGIKQALSQLL